GCPLSSLIRSGEAKCQKCGECFRKNRDPRTSLAGQALEFASRLISSNELDFIVLDEISHPLRHNLLTVEQVTSIITAKPSGLELVLTGRGMPQEIIDLADYVTEMYPVKHPFKKGIESRRGIEY
ncbi:MAG TPA: cob(I)yrinic acid a,c-diamide adenosyltransferase, partial [Bacillota bacterium]|nr:cob(I)yrinic acid a,c-diamide adenosyltransferase [Bacillota bacterium]